MSHITDIFEGHTVDVERLHGELKAMLVAYDDRGQRITELVRTNEAMKEYMQNRACVLP